MSFYFCLDHPSHKALIPGGLWGFYNERNRRLAHDILEIVSKIFAATKWSRFMSIFTDNSDNLLSTHVWSRLKNHSIIHDSYYCNDEAGDVRSGEVTSRTRAFPTRRDSFCYVGSSSCCREGSLIRELPICPLECRLKPEWSYC